MVWYGLAVHENTECNRYILEIKACLRRNLLTPFEDVLNADEGILRKPINHLVCQISSVILKTLLHLLLPDLRLHCSILRHVIFLYLLSNFREFTLAPTRLPWITATVLELGICTPP